MAKKKKIIRKKVVRRKKVVKRSASETQGSSQKKAVAPTGLSPSAEARQEGSKSTKRTSPPPSRIAKVSSPKQINQPEPKSSSGFSVSAPSHEPESKESKGHKWLLPIGGLVALLLVGVIVAGVVVLNQGDGDNSTQSADTWTQPVYDGPVIKLGDSRELPLKSKTSFEILDDSFILVHMTKGDAIVPLALLDQGFITEYLPEVKWEEIQTLQNKKPHGALKHLSWDYFEIKYTDSPLYDSSDDANQIQHDGPMWKVDMPPSHLAWRMRKVSHFGEYASDQKAFKVEKIIAQDKSIDADSAGMSHIFYHKNKRSYPRLMGALQKELPKGFSNIKSPGGLLNQSVIVANSVDSDTAVKLAEANLRLAMGEGVNNRIEALVILANTYIAAGDKASVMKIINQGEAYTPVSATHLISDEFDGSFKADQAKDVNAWNFHYAIALGDQSKAQQSYDSLTTSTTHRKLKDKQRKSVEKTLKRRLNAVGKPIGHGLNGEQEKALNSALNYIRLENETKGWPLVVKLAGLNSDEIVAMIPSVQAAYGRQSIEVADMILYLVEQRGYDGVGIDVATLLWSSIFIKGKYHGTRSLAAFMLTQKTGILNRGKTHSKKMLADQFVVECGPYFGDTSSHTFPLNHVDWMIELALQVHGASIEVSTRSAESTKARGYYSMAVRAKWATLQNSGHNRDRYIESLVYMSENGATHTLQNEAREKLHVWYMWTQFRSRAYELGHLQMRRAKSEEDIKTYNRMHMKLQDEFKSNYIRRKIRISYQEAFEKHADNPKLLDTLRKGLDRINAYQTTH